MIMIVVALFAGYIVNSVLKTKTRAGIIITGIFAGLFVGFIMFGGAIRFMGIQSWYLMGMCWFFFMVTGEELSRRYGKKLLKWNLAIMGGYLFMRGATFILKGYPSEMEIYTSLSAGKYVEISSMYFIYIPLFLAMFAASVVLQNKSEWVQEQDETLSAYFKKDIEEKLIPSKGSVKEGEKKADGEVND